MVLQFHLGCINGSIGEERLQGRERKSRLTPFHWLAGGTIRALLRIAIGGCEEVGRNEAD